MKREKKTRQRLDKRGPGVQFFEGRPLWGAPRTTRRDPKAAKYGLSKYILTVVAALRCRVGKRVRARRVSRSLCFFFLARNPIQFSD